MSPEWFKRLYKAVKALLMNYLSNVPFFIFILKHLIVDFNLLEAQKELEKFMIWFQKHHPDLYEKYGRNIKLPFNPGGGVGISNDFKISHEEHEMLTKTAKEYYFPPLEK